MADGDTINCKGNCVRSTSGFKGNTASTMLASIVNGETAYKAPPKIELNLPGF